MIISVVFHCVGELDHTHNGIKSCIFRNLRYFKFLLFWDFPGGSAGKESSCNVGDLGLIPGLGRFPWRRESLPTPVFWPAEFVISIRGFKTHTFDPAISSLEFFLRKNIRKAFY